MLLDSGATAELHMHMTAWSGVAHLVNSREYCVYFIGLRFLS